MRRLTLLDFCTDQRGSQAVTTPDRPDADDTDAEGTDTPEVAETEPRQAPTVGSGFPEEDIFHPIPGYN